MTCHEVALEHGTFHITVERDSTSPFDSEFVAELALVEAPERPSVRPLVFQDGRRVNLRGRSEEIAVSAAIVFLGARYGAICEPEHVCLAPGAANGLPVVIAPSDDAGY
jgi:hypothetical protein